MTRPLHSPHLTRFWFPATRGIGVGVTAYSLEQARAWAEQALPRLPPDAALGAPVLNVDVRELDQDHVVPNMGPCNLEGVWYPAVPR